MLGRISFILLSLSVFQQAKTEEEDLSFAKYDYCKLNCNIKGKIVRHSACKAKLTPPRVEVLYPPQEVFRQTMVDEHNKFRDLIASGNEKRPVEGWAGSAANMMVMNYDLETEYIARCRAVHSFVRTPDMETGHDKCKTRMGWKKTGQNLAGSSLNRSEDQIGGVKDWYDEIKDIKKKEYFTKKVTDEEAKAKLGHFTEMVWWSLDLVGCWRAYNPDSMNAWRYLLICNYGSTIMNESGNHLGSPLYKQGEPCSDCPNNTKCEKVKYQNLCGPLKPVTKTEAPVCGAACSTLRFVTLPLPVLLSVGVLNL